VITNKKQIINLRFEEFKEMSFESVRKDNNLDKVESWKDYIIHTEFYEDEERTYYSGNIYFIKEISSHEYFIKVYKYSYCTNVFYEDGFELLDRVLLSKIVLLENALSKSNELGLYEVLQKINKYTIIE
jgi:hypothetical protein